MTEPATHLPATGPPAAGPPAAGERDALAGLVTGAVAGDRHDLDALLRVLRPVAVRYCRSRLGPGEADDVAQEVMIAVLSALPRYVEQGRPFLAFVHGIAAHKVADAFRRRRDPTADRSRAAEDDLSGRPDPAAGPEELAVRGSQTAEVLAVIATMPVRQQEVLRLRVALGLSAEETAVAVGSTPGAVRVAQHRALQRLRATLGGRPAASSGTGSSGTASSGTASSGPTGDRDLDALFADAEARLREVT